MQEQRTTDTHLHLGEILGHTGITANGEADAAAKMGHFMRERMLLQVTKSIARVIIQSVWETRKEKLLTSPSPHHGHLHNIDPHLLSRVPSELPRAVETIAHRLRLNVAYTDYYKFKHGWIDSPDCPGCGGPQTTEHIFCVCALHFVE